MWIEFEKETRLGGRTCAKGHRRNLPDNAALALIASGRARKVFADHAPVSLASPVVVSAAPAPVDDGPDPEETVLAALNNGRKAALVAALRLVGLDPDDYANNVERQDALLAWMEAE